LRTQSVQLPLCSNFRSVLLKNDAGSIKKGAGTGRVPAPLSAPRVVAHRLQQGGVDGPASLRAPVDPFAG
jgi:hypothetical protein